MPYSIQWLTAQNTVTKLLTPTLYMQDSNLGSFPYSYLIFPLLFTHQAIHAYNKNNKSDYPIWFNDDSVS